MKTILETDHGFICDIQAPCFQMLSPDEAELVRASKTQVLFRKNDLLTKQGAFASYVLFLIKGLATQYLEGDGVKNYNLRVIRPGEFVGLQNANLFDSLRTIMYKQMNGRMARYLTLYRQPEVRGS